MEVVEDGAGRLSVILAAHPKLRNDLRRPTMEEISYHTEIFPLDGIAGSQREYIQWLLTVCSAQSEGGNSHSDGRSHRPSGDKTMRNGYRLKYMVEQFDAKLAEIRALFNHQLDPTRTAKLRDHLNRNLPLRNITMRE